MTEVSHVADEGLRDLLKAGDWNGVLETIGATAPEVQGKSTVKARKSAARKAFEKLDEMELLAMQEELSVFIDRLHSDALTLFTDDGKVVALTEDQKVALMEQNLSAKHIAEISSVIDEMVKEWVRATVAAQNAEAEPGDPWSQYRNGEIEVPATGKKFVLQGMGAKTPLIDEGALERALGEDWAKVTTTVIVPASEQTFLDEDKLRDLMKSDPSAIAKVEQALIHAGWKSGSVWTKDIE